MTNNDDFGTLLTATTILLPFMLWAIYFSKFQPISIKKMSQIEKVNEATVEALKFP